MYVLFNEDGTSQWASSRNRYETNPNVRQYYHFEGNHLVLVAYEVSDVPTCGDAPGIYEVYQLLNRNLLFVLVEDPCGPRVNTTATEYVPIK
jgi:hypothetical protein